MEILETALRIVAALVLAASGAVVAYAVADRLARGWAPPLLRAAAVIVSGMAVATVGFHILIPFSMFRLPIALGGALICAAATMATPEQRAALAAAVARDRRALARLVGLVRRSPRRMWITAFAVLAAPVVLRPFVVPPLGWDTLLYHATKPAFWVQLGGPALVLEPGPQSWDLTRNSFAGGEVFLAWAMLPMRGDLLLGVAQVVQWLAIGVTLLALAREVGVREPFATAAVGFVLALAPIRLEVGSGYVEVSLVVFLAAGLAFAVRWLRAREPQALVLAGLALGLACGNKIIALPVAAFAMTVIGVVAIARRRIVALGAAVGLCAAFAAPWMVYNWIDTGYPLSPMPVSILGVKLGQESAAIETSLHRPDLRYDWYAERDALERTFQSPGTDKETLGVEAVPPLFLFGLVAVPLVIARRRSVGLLLFGVFAINLAIVFGPSFAVVRLQWPEGVSRFWMPAVVAAIPASALWCERMPAAGRLYFTYLLGFSYFLLMRFAAYGCSKYSLHFMAVAAGLAGLVAFAAGRARRARWAVAALLGVAALTYIAVRRDENRYEAARFDTVLHMVGKSWVPLAEALDDGTPHRVAVTAGDNKTAANGLFYFFFGRRLQNDVLYVPVSKTGALVADPLHQPPGVVDGEAWLRRLRQLGVTEVASLEPPTLELRWMEASPAIFKPVVWRKAKYGLFKLAPETKAETAP
jgi:hypothetical protein